MKLICEGKSLREVAEIVGRSHLTVQYIINKYKNEGQLENIAGRGRKKY